MTKARALLALAALTLAALMLWRMTQGRAPNEPVPRAEARAVPHELLFVYNAVSGNASLVEAPGSTRARLIDLATLALGRWNVRIGVIDDHLLTLDTETKRVHALSLAWLRKQATAPEPTPEPGALRSWQLHANQVPYQALLSADRLHVDYFSANLIESYRWQTASGLEYLGERTLASDHAFGLSDLVIFGDRLWLAASGLRCLQRICPKETAPDPHLFGFALAAGPLAEPQLDLRPANVNAAGVYVHPDGMSAYLISAGEYRGGYSSVQRLFADGRLGPELTLARSAGAARGFALDARTCAIFQFSGEHVFLLDVREDKLLALLRFDGAQFVSLPLAGAVLAERAQSDFQDLLPDPAAKDRFFIVDSKREQLLHVAFHAPSTLAVLGTTSLRTRAFRSSPSWGQWLR